MKFIRDFTKLLSTKKQQFELDELKEVLNTDDEVYLLELAKEIEDLNLGKYYGSDCTVETLFLDKNNLIKVIISKLLKLISK